jgi:hypothetical protein
LGEKWPVNSACYSYFHVNRRVLLHAVLFVRMLLTRRPNVSVLLNISMFSWALVVSQSADRWHCESHRFLSFFIFFFCVFLLCFFLFYVPPPPSPVLPLMVTYKYAKRSRGVWVGGGRVFHEEFRRCFERSRGKKSSEETRFAQARGWARFTLALAKIV